MDNHNLALWSAFLGHALLDAEPEQLRSLAMELGECDTMEPAWRETLDALVKALDEQPEALRVDHTRLFYSPDGVVCPPWQSANKEEPRLMGDSHIRAIEWYRKEGIEPLNPGEPADHAGLLLVFYSRLLARDAPAEQLSAFAEDHLAWMSGFADCLLQHARHPFLLRVAEALRLLVG